MKISGHLLLLIFCSTTALPSLAQPSPRRRSPPSDDRRRYTPSPPRDDRRRYTPSPPKDDRRRYTPNDGRRRYSPSPDPDDCLDPACTSCPYHAAACVQCRHSYVLNRYTQTCQPCSLNCWSCSNAYGCDVCNTGYFVSGDRTHCTACAANCLSCSDAYRCDKCDAGFFNSRDRSCTACAANCYSCHDSTPQGCDSCNYWYTLRPGGCVPWTVGFGGFLKVLLMVLLYGCTGLTCLLGLCCCCTTLADNLELRRARSVQLRDPFIQQRSVAPQPSSSLSTATPEMAAERPRGTARLPPSGTWSGRYTYNGTNHDVCEFHLNFSEQQPGMLAVTGSGVDDVGSYSIQGRSSYGTDRQILTFSKSYRLGSRNAQGIVSEDNEGHTVLYHGALVGDNMGAGFRGTWRIRNDGTDGDGNFHLWPAMEEWASQRQEYDPGELTTEALHPRFVAAESAECIVCMDRSITTCLVPCGHIALCSQCARRVQKCPLCRVRIEKIQATTLESL